MRLHFFNVPLAEPGPAASELNAFLATHRVVAVDRELVHDGPRSVWAVCVTVAGGTPERVEETPTPGQPRVDYKAALPPDQFEVFVRLRELGWAGWPAVDPALVVSAGSPCGKDLRAVGVLVGAAESPSNTRRSHLS